MPNWTRVNADEDRAFEDWRQRQMDAEDAAVRRRIAPIRVLLVGVGAELGAALAQVLSTDDQIIVAHMERAHALIQAALNQEGLL